MGGEKLTEDVSSYFEEAVYTIVKENNDKIIIGDSINDIDINKLNGELIPIVQNI